jgi:phosphatidylglycerophosphatase A
MWLLLVVAYLLGWWASTVTAQHMGICDSSHMVWDEVVAFWALLWLASASSWQDQLPLFVLFRLFDSVKVGPVAWADQAFKGMGARGGWGVMFDDLVAAALAGLVWWLGLELWRVL